MRRTVTAEVDAPVQQTADRGVEGVVDADRLHALKQFGTGSPVLEHGVAFHHGRIAPHEYPGNRMPLVIGLVVMSDCREHVL